MRWREQAAPQISFCEGGGEGYTASTGRRLRSACHPAERSRLMPGYQVKHQTLSLGDSDFHIRSLRDNRQYADGDGAAAAAGISPSTWPLFGLVWPSARILAGLM